VFPFRRAVRIGKRKVVNGNGGMESAALNDLTSGEGESSHRATMKRAKEGDELIAPGVVPGHFDGRLYSFGSRVAEEHAFRKVSGRQFRQLLSQLDQIFVIEIRA